MLIKYDDSGMQRKKKKRNQKLSKGMQKSNKN